MAKIKTSTTYQTYNAKLINGGSISTDYQRLALTSYRSGNENPRWRQQISEGGNATTVLSAYQETASDSGGFWSGTEYGTIKSSSMRQGVYLSPNPSGASFDSDLAVAQAKATAKAYKILNKLTSTFSGQVFAGELKETKDLLLHPLEQSARLVRALVHARKVGKEAARSWLEFQFGIRPLLSDVDAICDLLNKKVERIKNLNYRAYGSSSSGSVSTKTSGYDIYGFNQTIEDRTTVTVECVKHFAVSQKYLDEANNRRTDWSSSFTDLTAVPGTVWELLPWSFLVDYFVNVSDIVQAASTCTTGLSYMSNSTIRTYKLVRRGSTDSVVAPRFVITANVPRVFKYQKRWVDRDGTPLGIPSVVFSLPGSNIRYLNIAALLASFKL